MATTFQPRPVYESLKDLQPVLGDLYIGNNKEFEQLICPNCKLIAVNPSDCANCSEQICIFCQESAATTGDGQLQCGGCKQVLAIKDGSLTKTGASTTRMFANAMFSCPYECKSDISYQVLEVHVSQQCMQRAVLCKTGCGQKFRAADIEEHEKLCPYRRTKCRFCNEIMHHFQLENHQSTVCFVRQCTNCDEVFLVADKRDHSCIQFTQRLLRECVGSEAYSKALQKLHTKTFDDTKPEKTRIGSLPNIYNRKLAELWHTLDKMVRNNLAYQSSAAGSTQLKAAKNTPTESIQVKAVSQIDQLDELCKKVKDLRKFSLCGRSKQGQSDTCFVWPPIKQLKDLFSTQVSTASVLPSVRKIEYHVEIDNQVIGSSPSSLAQPELRTSNTFGAQRQNTRNQAGTLQQVMQVIQSLKLTFSDGTSSPTFGVYKESDCSFELKEAHQLRKITVLFDENSVRGLRLINHTGATLLGIGEESSRSSGRAKGNMIEKSFDLNENERLVGCYGLLNTWPKIVSIGFITNTLPPK